MESTTSTTGVNLLQSWPTTGTGNTTNYSQEVRVEVDVEVEQDDEMEDPMEDAAEDQPADGEVEPEDDGEDQAPAAASVRREWEGVLAVVGHPTSDRRMLIPGEISHRDLPLPFLVQTATEDGHRGAETCGRIEAITHIPADEFDRADEFNLHDLTEGATVVFAEGTLDGSEHQEDAVRMIENGAGVSIDMPPERVAPFDPKTLEEMDPKEISFEDIVFGNLITGIAGKIAAATIVSIPAFEEASVALVSGQTLVASAYPLKMREATITASAAGLAPLKPPAEWFYMDETAEPTPLTVTEDGHVFGHLALWGECHVGFASCERPPRSESNYSFFHVGQIETEQGDLINVGRITVGKPGAAKGGHASLVLGRQGAIEHYDSTGCVAAFVRARDGVHGIWLSGAIRSDVPAERIRDLRANPPSGDWRDYELVAVLSVPVPGFPIPRAEARLVASGADEEIPALIATGYTSEKMDILTYRRKLRSLKSRAQAVLGETVEPFYWEEGGSRWEVFKDYPAAERRKMAKDGRALPDGSFPIADCGDAEDAIRSQGRADPAKRNRVRAHIRRRVRSLGCSGSIFEPYK